MAQQGRNDNTYGFDELAFWRPIDAENRHVYRAVLRESRAIQDEAQDILNRFAGLSMMGLLPKAQVERLHRDIAHWKKQGESTSELRLLMQDAQRRTRMRCDEAMLLYLMHVVSDSYARISETDRDALLNASRIAYKRAFAEGNEPKTLLGPNLCGIRFQTIHCPRALRMSRHWLRMRHTGQERSPSRPLSIHPREKSFPWTANRCRLF
jgi:hypothetical protein